MRANWKPQGEITAAVEKTVMDRLETAADLVAARARMLVPVQTGALRDSIRVTRLKGDPKLNIRVYAGSRVKGGSMKKGAERGAFYARWVEYGSVHNDIPRKSYLRPALNEVRGRVKTILETG